MPADFPHAHSDWYGGRVQHRPLWGHVVAATEKLVRSPRGAAAKKTAAPSETACGVRKTAGFEFEFEFRN